MTRRSGDAASAHRRLPRWWIVTAVVLLVAYAALTVLVVVRSPLGDLDRFLYHAKIAPKSSPWHTPLLWWIWIGQGVPCSTLAALYAIRRSAVTRSWRPWVMFCIALIALNVSVGAMKHATGRLGPAETNKVYTILSGGTIYPSGHTANAVVMYGLIAMLAPLAHRRVMTIIATVVATTVALGTVMIRTHWISDVFGGWIAGVLVLQLTWLLTPWATRLVERTADRILPALGRWWAALEFHQTPAARVAAPNLEPRSDADVDPAVGSLVTAQTVREPAEPISVPSAGNPETRAPAESPEHPPYQSRPTAPRTQRTVTLPPDLGLGRLRRGTKAPVDAGH